jgi:hypothetical protein
MEVRFPFLDKGNLLISIDTKYTQPLQQRITPGALRMHTAKKRKIQKVKNKSPATAFQLQQKQYNHHQDNT